MIGNNSCGTHSIMAGKTVDNIEELEILTYDGLRLRVGATPDDELAAIIAAGGRRGAIYAGLRHIRDTYADDIRGGMPRIPRRVSGYNLDQLLPENGFHVARALVGSEGTLALTLEATCRLVHSPPARTRSSAATPVRRGGQAAGPRRRRRVRPERRRGMPASNRWVGVGPWAATSIS
jgi:FAD/FMN-containing dehydrogenase